VFADLKLFAI